MTDTPVNPDMPDHANPAQEPIMDNDAGHARIAMLEEEVQSLKDRVLRTMAEMENLRRRTEKEKADASVYAIAKFARDMLNVSDNLSRALSAVPVEARAGDDETLKALIEGVELTERDMLNQLERHNVNRLSPKGEKFDPNFHQAMFEAVNPTVPNGTVMEVVQDGFVIGDRVLRPALVGVAKGGPKLAPVAMDDEPQASAAQKEADIDTPEVETSPSNAGAHVDRSI